MLDATLSLDSKLPPFTANYLEHRVNKEPEHGSFVLVCIRHIAQQLATDAEAIQRYIKALCTP
jgi:hypothetical protein